MPPDDFIAVLDMEASHIIAVFHDVSGIEAMESRLTHYEFRDHITGLFNRRSLKIILDMELEKAREGRGDYFKALLFIGITTLTRWVLLQTADQIAPLGERHGIFFNVNLSFFDLMDPDIEDLIQKILRENGGTPQTGSSPPGT